MLVRFNTKDARIYGNEIDAMEKKINRRLGRYFTDPDTQVSVKFTEKRLEFKSELTLTYLGCQLRAETKDTYAFSSALDKCLDIMERQITKCKGKLEPKRQVNDIIETYSVEPEPDEYRIAKVKEFEMKQITVQDAILQMNMLGHQFYTFYSSDYNCIATVYKRDDGDYGLIIPKG